MLQKKVVFTVTMAADKVRHTLLTVSICVAYLASYNNVLRKRHSGALAVKRLVLIGITPSIPHVAVTREPCGRLSEEKKIVSGELEGFALPTSGISPGPSIIGVQG